MAILRFPNDVGNGDRPYVVFSTHKATYQNNATGYTTDTTNNSVALYLPANCNINDIINYEMASTGIIGNAFERLTTGTNLSNQDLLDAAEAVAFDKAEGIASVGGAAIGKLLGNNAGAIAGAVTAPGVVGNVKAEIQKKRQESLNPRDFMLFKSPGIRQFGFNFNFIPSDENEVNAIPDIIKFFRLAAYPEVITGGLQYKFPEAFNIKFQNSDQIIKIPEVVCINTSVTYNPNSMSYYRVNNFPVEVNLQLSFQELQPINRAMVAQGF